MKLAEMRPGDRGRVVGFEPGAREYRRKLLSMGLTPGVELAVTRVAPLGDPIEITLRGYLMSLRLAEADVLCLERV
jgi:ferrous iron transport protein A